MGRVDFCYAAATSNLWSLADGYVRPLSFGLGVLASFIIMMFFVYRRGNNAPTTLFFFSFEKEEREKDMATCTDTLVESKLIY